MHSEGELGVELYGNVQFYSIPNIDYAMDHQSQKGSKRGPMQEKVKRIDR